jgi:competence protein ComEC
VSVLFGLRRRGGAVFALSLVLCLAAGYARYRSWESACEGDTVGLCGRWVNLTGVVSENPVVSGDSMRFKLSLEGALVRSGGGSSDETARGIMLVIVSGCPEVAPDVRYGDRVSMAGFPERPRPAANPGGFDRAGWLRVQGVKVEVRAEWPTVRLLERTGGNPVVRAALRVRDRLEAAADRSLPAAQAAMLKGIVLGSKSSLPEETEEAFRHAGVYHVLSVSGLHVNFVFGYALAILRMCRVGRRRATSAALLLLPCYALVTGLRPAVLRAIIMAAAAQVAPRVGRRADPVTSLASAAMIVVCLWPGSLLDPGFHLSFCATAGLISLAPTAERALASLPAMVRGPLSMTVAAQAATIPIVARQFQEVSVSSLVANPVIVPVAGYCTTLGFAAMIAGSIWAPAGVVINLPNRALLWVVQAAAHAIAALPGSFFYVGPPGPAEMVAYYGLLALVGRAFSARRLSSDRVLPRLGAALAASAVAVCVVSAAEAPPKHLLRVWFFDVGQGDAVLVTAPGGRALLVDAGPAAKAGAASAGKRVVVPSLRWLGVRSLDRVLLTHFHDDHYGGFADVLGAVKCGRALVPRGGEARAAGAGIKTVEVVGVCEGHAWETGGARFEVLHPPRGGSPAGGQVPSWEASDGDAPGDENDNSVVLRIVYGRTGILLTGDAGVAVEEALLRRARSGSVTLRASVLKAPHHGSDSGSSPAFLDAVRPSYCVVSVGPNSRRLPSARAMARLDAACGKVYRTDRHGAIRVESDGAEVRVTPTIAAAAGPG